MPETPNQRRMRRATLVAAAGGSALIAIVVAVATQGQSSPIATAVGVAIGTAVIAVLTVFAFRSEARSTVEREVRVIGASQAASDVEAADNLTKDLEQANSRVRVAATQVGEQLSPHYARQAEGARKAAQWFLALACVALPLLMIVAGYFLAQPFHPPVGAADAWTEVLADALPKALLLALIAYALRFAVRSYGISRNEQAVYTQKRVALDTYLLLTASLGDTDLATNREITVALVKIVFGRYDTGYLKGNDPGIVSALGIADVLGKGP